jgi:hypothetical protein
MRLLILARRAIPIGARQQRISKDDMRKRNQQRAAELLAQGQRLSEEFDRRSEIPCSQRSRGQTPSGVRQLQSVIMPLGTGRGALIPVERLVALLEPFVCQADMEERLRDASTVAKRLAPRQRRAESPKRRLLVAAAHLQHVELIGEPQEIEGGCGYLVLSEQARERADSV